MRWAREHPEEMEQIAALPLSQQNEALRGAIERPIDTLERLDHKIEDLYTDEDMPEREDGE